MTRVTIVGGSLTGNRGAASMVHGVVDGLRAAGLDPDVVVLSPLADDDRGSGTALPVEAFGPTEIVRSVAESAAHHVSARAPLGPATRAIADADVVVDVSGISFVDSRGGAILTYNVLLLLPALLLDRPVVKAAQAMGPFERSTNHAAATAVLERLSAVLTRGDRTDEFVRDLGIAATRADDVAFLMDVTDRDRAWADQVAGPSDYAVVSPSSVVVAQDDDGYQDTMAAVVADLAIERPVLLLPHSSRPGQPESKLNDLPLCERLAARADTAEHPVVVVGADATPQQMRALIGGATVCVTSRFHAMISSLAMATPVVVVSWSHKYREVLAEFGLPDAAIDFRAVTATDLLARVRATTADADNLADRIRAALPAVLDRARVNITSIRPYLESPR